MKIDNKSPIIRRQIVEEISRGDFSTIALVHMAHYDTSVANYINTSKRLGRPIDVANIGSGDMWDLRVLIHGRKMKKSTILRSYHAFDIENRKSPFGAQLSLDIKFVMHTRDLLCNPKLNLPDKSIDVVTCTEFIEHITKEAAQQILMEIHRILRKGGLLYLTTPNADNSSRSDKYHLYEWPLVDLCDWITSSGYKICEIYGTYIDMRTYDKYCKDDKLNEHRNRFTSNFFRVIAATEYPQYSNGIAMLASKR